MKELTITITAAELDKIVQGLTLLPWKDANPILVKLQHQVSQPPAAECPPE